MLDRKVSVNVSDIALEKVLLQLEKEAQVKFSFNSRALQLDRPVSINATNEPLSSVLTRLLKPLKIKHIQVSNRIVLRKDNASTTGLWENDLPTKSLEYQLTESIVTGTVTDENGQGLPGVSVLIKGTQRGTTTDAVGKYKLALSDNNEVLVFSFVGYLSQEIRIGSQTTLDVSLKLDTKALEEVVVVGYGVQRKKDLTGAVSTISSEMFKERKETQVAQALQGAMSGVMVTRNGANGAMGGATIRIRGVTTIGNSDPLVIVDGVPVSDVNQVNPNDIENLSVLKDAASASIYGSRAASGVILITTKRAKTDQASIQYSYENGFDTPTQLPDYMRSQRYMELVNELRWNDAGNGANRFPTFSQDLLTDYNQKHLSDPDRYPDTDWMALTLNKIAPREAHSISVIGGSKFVKSNASVRYEKVGGFYDNKNYNRIFVRSNNDFTINKLIGGTVDFNFKRTNALDPTASDPLYRTRISSPIYPAIWADGRIADGKAGENVYAKVKYGGTDRNTYNQVGGDWRLTSNPLKA